MKLKVDYYEYRNTGLRYITYDYEGLHKYNVYVQSNGDHSKHRLDTYARNGLWAEIDEI